jgi:hypothetical protein
MAEAGLMKAEYSVDAAICNDEDFNWQPGQVNARHRFEAWQSAWQSARSSAALLE